MIEKELTSNLQGLLAFIEAHVSEEIADRGTFDPYGILLKWDRDRNAFEMMFLETVDDSDDVLKGRPGPQMQRRIEDMICHYRNDLSVESAALVIDASARTVEGDQESDAIIAWLDDRGKQAVHVIIFYELKKGIFIPKEKVFEPREKLFLPSKEDINS